MLRNTRRGFGESAGFRDPGWSSGTLARNRRHKNICRDRRKHAADFGEILVAEDSKDQSEWDRRKILAQSRYQRFCASHVMGAIEQNFAAIRLREKLQPARPLDAAQSV